MKIFVARQPIFDKQKEVIAYELLFRDGVQNYFPTDTTGENATYNVISSSYMSIGFEALTGGKRGFINFTERNIESGLAKLVPEKYLTVEILETVEPTHEIIKACLELKKLGYQIVLDDFVFKPKYQPLINIADIVKIDFLAVPNRERRQFYRKIIPADIILLAEKVETEEDFQQGIEFGYNYFQGYFFSKPVIVSYKEIPPSRLLQLQLVQKVNLGDFDVQQLEDLIKHDVSLSYKLFKYTNSAWLGLRNEIKSIKQALVILGQNEVRRWVALVTLRDLSEAKPAELLNTAIIRARFCEKIASLKGDTKLASSAFIVGMFSLLDALLDRNMDDILKELSIAHEVADALLRQETTLGLTLQTVIAYEQADWDMVEYYCEKLVIDKAELPDLYSEAILWVNRINET